ncbi:hypothetical protein ACS0TY_009604 [Phlomoides rotata]
MSKSLDNYYTIREVTELYHPLALRHFLLGTHYRSLVNFSISQIEISSEDKVDQHNNRGIIITSFVPMHDLALNILDLMVLQQLKDKALRSAGVTEDDVLRSIEERMLAHKNKGFSKGDQFWCYFCLFLILIFSAFVFIISVSNLRWNKLQDSIPPEIGDLKQPTHLYLSFNNFKGKIPKELANLPELRYLQLHENRLIERIPAELGTLPNLRHLDVGNNHLIGTIRELIRIDGCFPALRNLYLNNNYLTVGIPSQLSNLTKLEILYLSYNKMSRVVPFGVAHIPRLTYLYLDHNQFSRRIPETFYKHPFLKEMYIEGNSFRPGVKSHPNITKLHGYCIDGEVILLVYEFTENALLDHYIDKGLKWGVRFQIIMGIARGLVYLHQDSGLRVIFRDLNLRNILLDLQMNPKITGFYLARELLELNQSVLQTSRIVGTFGYMPPEYIIYGKISVKTVVYSFGIILKIANDTKYFPTEVRQDILEDVWKLWTEGRAIDLVDDSMDASGRDEAIRCIQVALLCIQEHPDQRPTMPTVIKMLEGNDAATHSSKFD